MLAGVQENENRGGGEAFLEALEYSFTFLQTRPVGRSEITQRGDYCAIISYEPTVKVDKTKETLNVFARTGCYPVSYRRNLLWVHPDLPLGEHKPQK